jgi:hypothetical protein
MLIDDVMETVGEDLDFFMAALLMKPEEFDATFLRELIENGVETSFALLEILCSKTVKVLIDLWLDQWSARYLNCLILLFRNLRRLPINTKRVSD